jgi:dTDP-4-dehydrorhamnose reductase
MNRTKVLVLGASGMLGNIVFRTCLAAPGLKTTATIRSSAARGFFSEAEQENLVADMDVLNVDSLTSLLNTIRPDVVVNCVGLIKQLSSAKDPLVALPINALFPHKLARLCALAGMRLIHISTDCVFSGSKGEYTEDDVSDAEDLYGKSKYLGELHDYDNAVTLRTSIIGRELSSTNSLVDWFLAQEGEVKGFDKAIFSGLPTCELATLIRDVVIPNPALKGLYHVSAKPISKYELLRLIATEYKKDISILREDQFAIDRSLVSTRFSRASGYVAPNWPDLIKRMHDADFRGDK